MTGGDARRVLGKRGELLARRHLEARGLEILDANFRSRHGELDVVAGDARQLVFCEVKTRVLPGGHPAELGPFAAIGHDKRRRLRRMAREWLAARAPAGHWPPGIRFDAIGISFDAAGHLIALEHLEEAF